jgi:hypothetical protein
MRNIASGSAYRYAPVDPRQGEWDPGQIGDEARVGV